MTAAQILAIDKDRPEDLYPGDPEDAKRAYRSLSKQWHPDSPGGSDAVFAHLSELYREALRRLAAGEWRGAVMVTLKDAGGNSRTYHALASTPTPMGQTLVCADRVVYVVDSPKGRYATHAASVRFHFASKPMEEECRRYLPTMAPDTTLLADGRRVIEVTKTPDLIRLRDVVTHLGTLDAKHAAWIISSLMNLACYLSYAGLVHLDISPDTYFISPEHHSGALLGGWWFWANVGSPLTVVPRRTAGVMPFKAALTKRAHPSIDLELIRLTGREILSASAPAPMRAWLAAPGSGSAYDQYREWQTVLKQAFGERRFAKLPITSGDVYGSSRTHA